MRGISRGGWAFVLAFGAVSLAPSARAATVTITSDKATYVVGETITLTVAGDPESLTQGTMDNNIQGAIAFPGELVTGVSTVQSVMVKTYYVGMPVFGFVTAPWGQLYPLVIEAGAMTAFSQLEWGLFAPGATADANPNLGTLTLSADAPGTVDVTWYLGPDPQFGSQFDFFGLTNAPGTSFDITAAVPEPTTAALLSLGLASLASIVRGRRR